MRVLVTGGRDFDDQEMIFSVLDDLHRTHDIKEIITGACPYGGADLWAEQWAKANEIDYRGIPAKFKTQGKAAGPRRNKRMLKETKPDLVVAFPGGRGTMNTVNLADSMRLKVIDLRLPNP